MQKRSDKIIDKEKLSISFKKVKSRILGLESLDVFAVLAEIADLDVVIISDEQTVYRMSKGNKMVITATDLLNNSADLICDWISKTNIFSVWE